MGSTVLSINTNLASQKGQRQLAKTSEDLSSTYTRLSSGLRINTASDDAAGLAVASSLKANTRIYSQAVRNLSDGISALNIADGALSCLSDITIRLQELAEQAANGTLGPSQRKSLDDEAQALAKEYFRISRTTSFNGLNLFDGTVQGLRLQCGYGADGSVISSLGGSLGTGTFGGAISQLGPEGTYYAVAAGDLNGDGILDLAAVGGSSSSKYSTICLGNGDGTFNGSLSFGSGGSTQYAVALKDLNGDGELDFLAAGTGGAATIRLGNGDGTFKTSFSYQMGTTANRALEVADLNGDGILDLVTAGAFSGVGYAAVRLGKGDGTFGSSLSYQTEGSTSYALSLADLNNDGILDLVTAGDTGSIGRATIRLGNGDGTFASSITYDTESDYSRGVSLADLNGDGILDLVTAGDTGSVGACTVRLGNGNGTFGSAISFETESDLSYAVKTADIDGDGISDVITAGRAASGFGYSTILIGNGDGTFESPRSYEVNDNRSNAIALADINRDGVLDLVSGGGSGFVQITVRLADTRDGVSAILPFSLKTLADARQAIPMLKDTLDRLSIQRGEIGAFQSRIKTAGSVLSGTVLDYQAAKSRIEDADVAGESAALLRQQILQQSAASVLSQANQAPALALKLLQG